MAMAMQVHYCWDWHPLWKGRKTAFWASTGTGLLPHILQWLVSGGLNMNGGGSSWDGMYEGVFGVRKTTSSCSSSTSDRTASTIIGNGK